MAGILRKQWEDIKLKLKAGGIDTKPFTFGLGPALDACEVADEKFYKAKGGPDHLKAEKALNEKATAAFKIAALYGKHIKILESNLADEEKKTTNATKKAAIKKKLTVAQSAGIALYKITAAVEKKVKETTPKPKPKEDPKKTPAKQVPAAK
jgi:hypothetical protein